MEPFSRRIPLATGLTYHVLEWGKDDPSLDHTVILVHGFLDLGWGFAPLVRKHLAGSFHVIAPDMRGHGDSDRVGKGGYYYFFDYLADLDSLVQEVGRKRVSLVGHSMGGMIASYYAGLRSGNVHKLALLEGILAGQSTDPVPDRVGHWISAWSKALQRENQVYPNVAAAADRMQKHDGRLSREHALELARKGTRAVPGGVSFKHDPVHLTRGPYPFSLAIAEPFWQRITCPVLFVDAADSALPLDQADYARRKANFPHAQSVEIKNAGHLMQRHQPDALGAHLLSFLS